MELLLAGVALLIGLAALGLTLAQRDQLARAQQGANAAAAQLERTQSQLESSARSLHELQSRLDQTRVELDQARQEITALQTVAETPPPLTLPRARTGALDDLREQLRAAQQEAEETEES
jgi:peptidoglycan hydrolase CwlO-like protein